MRKNRFINTFSVRCLLCFIIITALFFSCILRTAVISTSNYAEVQKEMSSLKIKITNTRGTVFDCNRYPITNNVKKIIACISPTPRAITAISQILSGEELENVLEILKTGKPAVCTVPEKTECDGIVYTEVYTNQNDISAIHTVGYTDSENKGVSGIQKAYDNILYNSQDTFVRYACDAKERILNGVSPEIINVVSPFANGVITTIDINIQNAAEKNAEYLGKGAIIIADTKTAKIRGIASVPKFRYNEIINALENEDTPLYNRAFAAYNVGSVFKPCVAAAGLEKNLEYFTYNCTGSCKIIDRVFKCHNHSGHGNIKLESAIANSCNTYFYNFGIKTGKTAILELADTLNFGKRIKLCDGIYSSSGILPTERKLENTAHLANFSIGQGDFTAAPVSLLPLYCAIANGGEYYLPSIVESTVVNGKKKSYYIGKPTKAFKNTTAEKLKKALLAVITDGTGNLAKPKTVSAAGKTATAQTGKYENGKEIISSWFCGFFPFENPQYTVIIFCENSNLQKKSCAEIFSKIADTVTELTKTNGE